MEKLRNWFRTLDDKTKKKLRLKCYQLAPILLVILFLPFDEIKIGARLAYCAVFILHAVIDWLLSVQGQEEGNELRKLGEDISSKVTSVKDEITAVAKEVITGTNESRQRQKVIAEGVAEGLREVHEVSKRTASALAILHETRQFDSFNNVHMAILRRISDKFFHYPCSRDEYSDILATGIRASESWLGIHADSLTFFTQNSHARAYSHDLAERANSLGKTVRQVRLVISTDKNKSELSDEAILSEYLNATPGVKSFWMSEKEFKSKFHDLAKDMQDDWALFDECLVLHYDNDREMMYPLLGGDQYESLRRLFDLLRRRDEHNDGRSTIHAIERAAR